MRVMIIGVAVLFFTLFTYDTIEAQSAVYVCTKTGRYGVAFDDGNPPRMNMDQTKQEAQKRCRDTGGEDCQLFFSNHTKGWYTFYTGNEKGTYTFAVGKSMVSEQESMNKAIDEYLQTGGRIMVGCQTLSWYAPTDAIGYNANNSTQA
ncbi:MAG: hypothetical protein IBJ16_14585 [Chitinophagaceae bacterium]|nr:hypothetical protein [Chitinophagaceae bacterium]